MTKYYEGIGRRKTAVARVRLSRGVGFVVNDKSLKDYFGGSELRRIAKESLLKKMKVSAKVKGGGERSQAEAVRHGVARGLLKLDATLKPALKVEGYLSRDPRKKERKKPGLKKARRGPQWSKR